MKRRSNVLKRAGPRAAYIPDTAVFEVGGRESVSRKGGAEMPSVFQVIFRTPKSSMDIED